MKKVFLSFALVGALIACNSNSESGSETTTGTGAPTDTAATTATTEPAAEDFTKHPDYQKGLEIEAKSDCATCHKINEKLVGPSFKDIATKYAGASDATVDSLASKIINGGAGNWGQIPMTPHPQMSKDDARAVVKYVLLLKEA